MAYPNNYFNPYGYNMYQQPMIQQQQPQQPQQMQPSQPIQMYRQPIGLQGKSVDSIEVVKATDIPLDGSISYFPLADGTAIVTKQLMQDGTSKTIVYKPVDLKEAQKVTKYVTPEELNDAIKKVDNSSLKDDIKTLKRQMKDIIEDIKEIEDRKD